MAKRRDGESGEHATLVVWQDEEECVIRLNIRVPDPESQADMDEERDPDLAGWFGSSFPVAGVGGRAHPGFNEKYL